MSSVNKSDYISYILINNENTSSGKWSTLIKQRFCRVRNGWQWWLPCQPIKAVTSRRTFLIGIQLETLIQNFPPSLFLSRKYAFSGFEKQFHKHYGTNFQQIWYNGASYHRTDLRKIWHLSLQKCESRNFSFLFIYRWYSELRCAHMYVGLTLWCIYFFFKWNCSMLGHKIPPKSTHSEFPHEGLGVKSRMCPPYPQRDRKRRLNGAVCRNHRIKRVVPCRC